MSATVAVTPTLKLARRVWAHHKRCCKPVQHGLGADTKARNFVKELFESTARKLHSGRNEMSDEEDT